MGSIRCPCTENILLAAKLWDSTGGDVGLKNGIIMVEF
jgi:hypothetical protein